MPAYNALPFIKEAIKSILDQTHQNIELLIADDASTDETKAYIDSLDDPRIVTYHNDLMSAAAVTFSGFMLTPGVAGTRSTSQFSMANLVPSIMSVKERSVL